VASSTIVGFTGHQGLDETTESLVRAALRVVIAELSPVVGVCSLAEGSDQLFAHVVYDAGGTLIVVIPCRGYEQTFTDPTALAAYQTLLERAFRTVELDYPEPSEVAFWAAGKRVVEEADRVVSVWDGRPAGGLGGTADVVEFARQRGVKVDVIWPDGSAR
jgi:hypothetical protein